MCGILAEPQICFQGWWLLNNVYLRNTRGNVLLSQHKWELCKEEGESCSPPFENDPTPDSSNSDMKSLFLACYLISTWTETAYFIYVFIYNIFKLYITHLNDKKAGKSPSTVVNRNKLIRKTPTIWNNPNKKKKELIAQYKSIIMAVRRRRIEVVHMNQYHYTKMRLHPIVVYKKQKLQGKRNRNNFSSQYSSVRVFGLGNLLYK